MNKEPSLDYIIEDLVKSLRGTEEDWQIKSIKAFILKALKAQRKEIVEEIEEYNKLLSENRGYSKQLDDSFPSIEKVFKEIINLITKEDGTL